MRLVLFLLIGLLIVLSFLTYLYNHTEINSGTDSVKYEPNNTLSSLSIPVTLPTTSTLSTQPSVNTSSFFASRVNSIVTITIVSSMIWLVYIFQYTKKEIKIQFFDYYIHRKPNQELTVHLPFGYHTHRRAPFSFFSLIYKLFSLSYRVLSVLSIFLSILTILIYFEYIANPIPAFVATLTQNIIGGPIAFLIELLERALNSFLPASVMGYVRPCMDYTRRLLYPPAAPVIPNQPTN